MITELQQKQTIANQFLLELRETEIQKDPIRFRNNLKRIGQVLAYEISQTLDYEPKEAQTPLGIAEAMVIKDQVVLGAILRAGLPLHDGLLDFFDGAQNAFVSAYRKHHKDGTFEIRIEYTSCPDIEGKVLILADPMLATGASMVKAMNALLEHGKPRQIHIVTVIASEEGINYLKRNCPPNTYIWTIAIDAELTAKSYIVPGLGDAGDLAYGKKVQE